MWRIDFTSDKFLPFLPEESQPNPGSYGFELAHWLARRLAHCGLYTSYPMSAEWGWFVEFTENDIDITIGCGCEARDGDGYLGHALPWYIFVQPNLRMNQRLLGLTPTAKLHEIVESVKWSLEEECISPQLTAT